MNNDAAARYRLAQDAARLAGDTARQIYESTFDVEWKSDQSPVTVADRQAEQRIRALVQQHFPQDGFLGEEFGDQAGTSGYRWVIDPIDGTRSFIRHIPLWATLVGLEFEGDPVGGICYIPCLGQTYHALRGHGAYLDDRRIRVSDISDLSKSLLCYSSVSWFRKAGRESMFLELAAQTERQRGFGDFYGFVLVAGGSCEMMIDHGVHPWDVSALIPIVEEAGGKMTNWAGVRTTESPDVIASNGLLHEATLAIMNR